jgi:hypothetical protein
MLHALLSLICDAYIKFMEKIKTVIDDETEGFNYHWRGLCPGRITLRDDSAVNLSPEAYREFVQPYNRKIYRHFQSVSMHFCGRADQWMDDLTEEDAVCGLNFGYMDKVQFGQPFLEEIYPRFRVRGVGICGYTLTREDAERFDFHRFGTGVSYVVRAGNRREGVEILKRIEERRSEGSYVFDNHC